MRITEPEFTQAMRDAVAERGEDWVYPKHDPAWQHPEADCRYFLPDGQPACLIGTALHKLGVPREQVPEGIYAGRVLREVTGQPDHFGAARGWHRAADAAQSTQDDGYPWGEALKAYLRALAE